MSRISIPDCSPHVSRDREVRDSGGTALYAATGSGPTQNFDVVRYPRLGICAAIHLTETGEVHAGLDPRF